MSCDFIKHIEDGITFEILSVSGIDVIDQREIEVLRTKTDQNNRSVIASSAVGLSLTQMGGNSFESSAAQMIILGSILLKS